MWRDALTLAAGLRHTDFTTQYPSQFTTACSFDRELVREMTERMSAEFAAKGVNVQLGPVSYSHACLTAAHWRTARPLVSASSTAVLTEGHTVGVTGKVSFLVHDNS